jgi:uncharacterized metal-binding protein
MDCTLCKSKSCKSIQACRVEQFQADEVIRNYKREENQKIVQAAAALVDNGRAGTLSRIQEIIAFTKAMGYNKIGLAYCFGMEKDVQLLASLLKENGLKLSAVSCSVGGLSQDEVNSASCTYKVSCNPLGQAEQLNMEGADFVIIVGICLGHDILLQRHLKGDFTTLVVKDRVYGHNPLQALR